MARAVAAVAARSPSDATEFHWGTRVCAWALVHLFQLQLQGYPLTLYHLDGAALARCTDLIDNRGAAATPVERMFA
jgi:hypothetical protein